MYKQFHAKKKDREMEENGEWGRNRPDMKKVLFGGDTLVSNQALPTLIFLKFLKFI